MEEEVVGFGERRSGQVGAMEAAGGEVEAVAVDVAEGAVVGYHSEELEREANEQARFFDRLAVRVW